MRIMNIEYIRNTKFNNLIEWTRVESNIQNTNNNVIIIQ